MGVAVIVVIAAIVVWTFLFPDPINPPNDHANNPPAKTVTVLAHGERGKDDLVLPNRGIVKLIFGDAIIPEQINNEGEATFKQIPEEFFHEDNGVEILFQDPEGEPYRVLNPDSLYHLTPGKYVALTVKLYGLERIYGVVRDSLTGDAIEGAVIRVQGVEAKSNKYGEYSLDLPKEKQSEFQTIRVYKEGYKTFEKKELKVQASGEVTIDLVAK